MEWYKVESASMPEEVDTTSSKRYNYVRKDIEECQREENGDTLTIYEYLECKVPKDSWSIYSELIQARADIDYLTMISE
ncbi:MAG: hypothetical protein K5669_11415 [Lachnospiraceae bacterium]|nr:hypothetical protein [Lachnospiraceae bacterium]